MFNLFHSQDMNQKKEDHNKIYNVFQWTQSIDDQNERKSFHIIVFNQEKEKNLYTDDEEESQTILKIEH